VAPATVIRDVAAIVHFGLLKRSPPDGYAVTELGQSLSKPLPDEEPILLKESFRNPDLYREVLARFDGEGRIPDHLETVLCRHFGITEKAAALAARVFIESGRFAGVLLDDLSIATESSHADDRVNRYGGSKEKASPGNGVESKSSGKCDGQQDFHFRLTQGNFAHLTVPSELTRRDVEIIRKQIELLDLQVGDNSIE